MFFACSGVEKLNRHKRTYHFILLELPFILALVHARDPRSNLGEERLTCLYETAARCAMSKKLLLCSLNCHLTNYT